MDKKIEKKLIIHNRKTHDIVASTYDEKHTEIFNPTEQRRIQAILQQAISEIKTKSNLPCVLDFGAGTGNLTRHLIDLQVKVVAADISPACLEQLKLNTGSCDRLQTVVLNGEDLSNITDNTFDMVATYSVLHHIPNYLKIIDEFVRVLKPGGVIYIDHEAAPSYWELNSAYQAYLGELGGRLSSDHLYELGVTNNVSLLRKLPSLFSTTSCRRVIRMFAGNEQLPNEEGDIHVYKHDHIEWGAIKSKLVPYCEILLESDYLVCRERSEAPRVWEKWRDRCVDMQMIVCQKRPNDCEPPKPSCF